MNRNEANTNGATIVIRLNGDETVASILDDQFGIGCTGQAIAKRNPADEYDAYTGARVALDRLFGKTNWEMEQTPKKGAEERKPRWKVGDLVAANGFPLNTGLLGGKPGIVTKVSPCDGQIRYEAIFQERPSLKYYQCWADGEKHLDAVIPWDEKTMGRNPFDTTPEKPMFKVGDIVRVVDTSASFGRYAKNDVAEVIEPSKKPGAGCTIRVRSNPRKGNVAFVYNYEIILLSRPRKDGDR